MLTGEVAKVRGGPVRAVAADGQLRHVEGFKVKLGHVGEVGSTGESVAEVGEAVFCVVSACVVRYRCHQGKGHEGEEGQERRESAHGYGRCVVGMLVWMGGMGGQVCWSSTRAVRGKGERGERAGMLYPGTSCLFPLASAIDLREGDGNTARCPPSVVLAQTRVQPCTPYESKFECDRASLGRGHSSRLSGMHSFPFLLSSLPPTVGPLGTGVWLFFDREDN